VVRTFTVTAKSVDANWNLISTNDTVRITSSDPNALLPGNAALSGGTRKLHGNSEYARDWNISAANVTHPGMAGDTSPPIVVGAGGEALWGMPVVAIHDSELTRALEGSGAAGSTPSDPGTTGFEWWPTNWHYFVMPEAMKETLRSMEPRLRW